MTKALFGEDSKYPDPRIYKQLRLGDLQIDPNSQRNIRTWKVARMAREWNWNQAEVPTVCVRNGNAFVVEGQHRFLAMSDND